MVVGVEVEDGVRGPARPSEGEGGGEEVEEDTEDWLIASTWPCIWKTQPDRTDKPEELC